jgi:hypothetical protein
MQLLECKVLPLLFLYLPLQTFDPSDVAGATWRRWTWSMHRLHAVWLKLGVDTMHGHLRLASHSWATWIHCAVTEGLFILPVYYYYYYYHKKWSLLFTNLFGLHVNRLYVRHPKVYLNRANCDGNAAHSLRSTEGPVHHIWSVLRCKSSFILPPLSHLQHSKSSNLSLCSSLKWFNYLFI